MYTFLRDFSVKIADLQLQLESAEAKVDAQRMELLEQSKVTATTVQSTMNAQPGGAESSSQDRHLCIRCGRSLSSVSNPLSAIASNSPRTVSNR